MLDDNGRLVKQEYDYIVTDEEVQVMLRECKRCSPKWQLALNILLFAGLRPSEALALRIQDFPGWKQLDFSTAYVRLAKQNKIVKKHFIEPLSHMIREYVTCHHDRLPSGWLFPKSGRAGYFSRPFCWAKDFSAFFSKFRKRLGVNWPAFLEKSPTGIYRVHPHSCRHWFQTRAARISGDAFFLKELMSYSKVETVMHYVSVSSMRDKAPEFLEKHYSGVMSSVPDKAQSLVTDF